MNLKHNIEKLICGSEKHCDFSEHNSILYTVPYTFHKIVNITDIYKKHTDILKEIDKYKNNETMKNLIYSIDKKAQDLIDFENNYIQTNKFFKDIQKDRFTSIDNLDKDMISSSIKTNKEQICSENAPDISFNLTNSDSLDENATKQIPEKIIPKCLDLNFNLDDLEKKMKRSRIDQLRDIPHRNLFAEYDTLCCFDKLKIELLQKKRMKRHNKYKYK
jgi:hypothetical protein